MSCAFFEDRLYDEDTRRALRGEGSLPSDLAPHRDTCPGCRQALQEAQEDERALARLLTESPPPALHARIAVRMRVAPVSRATVWTRFYPLVLDSLTAGAIATALSGALLGPQQLPWQVAVFAAGASLAVSGPALRHAPLGFRRGLDFLFAPH